MNRYKKDAASLEEAVEKERIYVIRMLNDQCRAKF